MGLSSSCPRRFITNSSEQRPLGYSLAIFTDGEGERRGPFNQPPNISSFAGLRGLREVPFFKGLSVSIPRGGVLSKINLPKGRESS